MVGLGLVGVLVGLVGEKYSASWSSFSEMFMNLLNFPGVGAGDPSGSLVRLTPRFLRFTISLICSFLNGFAFDEGFFSVAERDFNAREESFIVSTHS